MDGSENKKYENKYLEVALMLCYFLIPFFGLRMALKNYLQEGNLSFSYILLLFFVSGNIMTSLIFILNDKTVRTKSMWTIGLLLIMVAVNVVVTKVMTPA